MTEIERLAALLKEELMDDYDFDELATQLIARGVRFPTKDTQHKQVSFSSYSRKMIAQALVARCYTVCDTGTVEEIIKFVPYVLNKIEDVDFLVDDPITFFPYQEIEVNYTDAERNPLPEFRRILAGNWINNMRSK